MNENEIKTIVNKAVREWEEKSYKKRFQKNLPIAPFYPDVVSIIQKFLEDRSRS